MIINFHAFVCHLNIFFGKISVQVLCPFLNLNICRAFVFYCRVMWIPHVFLMLPSYLICGLHRLFKIQFFRAVLSSQQNWGEGTEFPYTPDPRHAFVTIKKPMLTVCIDFSKYSVLMELVYSLSYFSFFFNSLRVFVRVVLKSLPTKFNFGVHSN